MRRSRVAVRSRGVCTTERRADDGRMPRWLGVWAGGVFLDDAPLGVVESSMTSEGLANAMEDWRIRARE